MVYMTTNTNDKSLLELGKEAQEAAQEDVGEDTSRREDHRATVGPLVMCPKCTSTELTTKDKEEREGKDVHYRLVCQRCGHEFGQTVTLF